ncbi:amidohydrolase [Aureococcus anophagefferens]|nr:amidohydrolase [Aureococcus anophagefferens]
MPDDGVAEAAWVESLADRHKVAAVVAKCDLSAPDAAAVLDGLAACAPKLRGIRFILDYDGPFGEDNATHVQCSLHGLDYLRDPEPAAAFERGFASLAARGLSFDLQCCPAQLPAAAALCAKHPDVAVPQVCVKLSMLGFAVPGWTEHDGKRALVKSLVKETVDLFGPDRCMFASNWHINGAVSNSDGADSARAPRVHRWSI